MSLTGFVHSVQTMGAADGPGVRFVVFLQGCPLRCACCHNPDTWQPCTGKQLTAQEIVTKALRYRAYYGTQGGVTVSGGEPLLQEQFLTELFTLCHANGLHTCMDTSGYRFTEATPALLAVTDLVLLDIKYTNEADYQAYVGCSIEKPLAFLNELQARNIPTWLRQVSIPGKNDTDENLAALAAIAKSHPCVKRTELLGFRKLCTTKYDNMGMAFPFAAVPEMPPQTLQSLQAKLDTLLFS